MHIYIYIYTYHSSMYSNSLVSAEDVLQHALGPPYDDTTSTINVVVVVIVIINIVIITVIVNC